MIDPLSNFLTKPLIGNKYVVIDLHIMFGVYIPVFNTRMSKCYSWSPDAKLIIDIFCKECKSRT